MRIATLLLLGALVGCSSGEQAFPPPEAVDATAAPLGYNFDAPIPGDSIYQLKIPLIDQGGNAMAFDAFRGRPTLVSMFYASCPTACPMLIRDVQVIEGRLSEEERAELRVLLVSMDPERDTQERMSKVVERHGIDTGRWSLTRAEPARVREVAGVLGIKYRALDDGGMNHSSIITLVDRDGRIVSKLEGLKQNSDEFVASLQAL